MAEVVSPRVFTYRYTALLTHGVSTGVSLSDSQIQDWAENPEELVAASQRGELVRAAIPRLPEKYRVAVLPRDIEGLPTEEAAAALGVSIPAMKARLLRGRLTLRERSLRSNGAKQASPSSH
jgi:RNA polymerase sigma-70 factor, ECF subfamily